MHVDPLRYAADATQLWHCVAAEPVHVAHSEWHAVHTRLLLEEHAVDSYVPSPHGDAHAVHVLPSR